MTKCPGPKTSRRQNIPGLKNSLDKQVSEEAANRVPIFGFDGKSSVALTTKCLVSSLGSLYLGVQRSLDAGSIHEFYPKSNSPYFCDKTSWRKNGGDKTACFVRNTILEKSIGGSVDCSAIVLKPTKQSLGALDLSTMNDCIGLKLDNKFIKLERRSVVLKCPTYGTNNIGGSVYAAVFDVLQSLIADWKCLPIVLNPTNM
ncbi:hypothetical protein L596_011602 [Steinernema carpocapsae]|uniref:Uncharacterized protein n=1 Tax=Steinernema carpocapsae TaxID=34508 RepID=A0A4U5NUV8_STECR|nr:hypothetical protein L596_011602 [Steinernema carpocapsae]